MKNIQPIEKQPTDMEKITDKELLRDVRRLWDAIQPFRDRRRLCLDYAYGRQWNRRLVLASGRVTTAADQLLEEGRTPVTNNLIRQLIKTVVGKWRYLSSLSQNGEGDEPTLQCALTGGDMQRQGLDSRALEEFLISGCTAQLLTPDGPVNISPERLIFAPFLREDASDCRLFGILHDLPITEAIRKFGASNVKSLLRNSASGLPLFGEHREVSFDTGAPGTVRMIEIWRRAPEGLIRVHDPEEGEYLEFPGTESAAVTLRKLNVRRRDEGRPQVNCVPDIVDRWTHLWLTVGGEVLSCESLPEDARIPLAVRCYPMIDGEIHSLVEDVLSQQHYVNRLVMLLDEILRFSAKGVLLFPSDQVPPGMTWEQVRRLWATPGGVLPFMRNSKNITPMQIDTSGTSAGASEMLRTQLQLFSRISGTTFAGEDHGMNANSADMLRRQMENEMVALLDILATFQAFLAERDEIEKGRGCGYAQ